MHSLFPLPIGERARVRGFLTYSCDDCLYNTINIANYVIIPEPQNEIAVRFEVSCPLHISRVALGMLATVNLNYQARIPAAKVDDIG